MCGLNRVNRNLADNPAGTQSIKSKWRTGKAEDQNPWNRFSECDVPYDVRVRAGSARDFASFHNVHPPLYVFRQYC